MIAAVALAGDVLSVVADEWKIIDKRRAEKHSPNRNADGSDDQTSKLTRISHALSPAISLAINMADVGAAKKEGFSETGRIGQSDCCAGGLRLHKQKGGAKKAPP